jgi:hypothetical protein
MDCKTCEGTGLVEVYPPHGIEAYLPTGDVVVEHAPCPDCQVEMGVAGA